MTERLRKRITGIVAGCHHLCVFNGGLLTCRKKQGWVRRLDDTMGAMRVTAQP
jgi:hypothetical protein